MADQKLNLNINLGEIQYLGANSWHDWLWIRVHDSEFLVWSSYRIFTTMLRRSFWLNLIKNELWNFLNNLP